MMMMPSPSFDSSFCHVWHMLAKQSRLESSQHEASDGPAFFQLSFFQKKWPIVCYCLPSQPVSERVHGSRTPPPPPPPYCAGPMVRRVSTQCKWKAQHLSDVSRLVVTCLCLLLLLHMATSWKQKHLEIVKSKRIGMVCVCGQGKNVCITFPCHS